MAQNINRRLNKLEEELKCIMECRRADIVYDILREKCECPCKRNSASSSPSRGTKRGLSTCKSKSLQGIGRKGSKLPVLTYNYRPNCQKSKKNLLYGRNSFFKNLKPRSKALPNKYVESTVSIGDDVQILHEAKNGRVVAKKIPTIQSKNPAVNVKRQKDESNNTELKNIDKLSLCNPVHCAEIESVTKELKTELEIMKNQIMHLEENKERTKTKQQRSQKQPSPYQREPTKLIPNEEVIIRKDYIPGNYESAKSTTTNSDSSEVSSQTVKKYTKKPAETTNSTNNDQNKNRINKELLKEKENYIQSLTDTNKNLVKFMQEKDNDIKALQDALKSQQATCECLTQALVELKETIKMKECKCAQLESTLQEKDVINQKLSNSMEMLKSDLKQKSKHLIRVNSAMENEVKELHNKQSEMLKQLNDCTLQNMGYQQEIQRLQGMLAANQPDKSWQDQLCASRYRESQLEQELNMSQARLRELEHVNMSIRRSSDLEVNHLINHNASLQEKYDDLVRQLKQYEAFRNKEVETEISELQRTMSESEKTLSQDKEELRQLVDELTNIIKEQKAKIEELSDFNRHQDELLKSQSSVILAKDEQLDKSMSECCVLKNQIDNWKRKSDFLEHQLEIAKNVQPTEIIRESDHTDCHQRISQLLNELKDAKSHLEELNDTILLKEQIINDQTNSIHVLKAKVNERDEELNASDQEMQRAAMEIKRLTEDLCKMRVEYTRESLEKAALQNDLEELQWHKEQLKRKLEELEVTMQRHNRCQSIIEENCETIETLKDIIKSQSDEFEEELKRLTQEKNCAIRAAKFATQRLMETVQDFQGQVENHKKVQSVLTSLLNQKEEKIRCVVEQMSSMTLDLSGESKKSSQTSVSTAKNESLYECTCCEPRESAISNFTVATVETNNTTMSKKQYQPLLAKNVGVLEKKHPGVLAQKSSSLLATGYVEVDQEFLEKVKKQYEEYTQACRHSVEPVEIVEEQVPKKSVKNIAKEAAVSRDVTKVSSGENENPFLGILGSQSEVRKKQTPLIETKSMPESAYSHPIKKTTDDNEEQEEESDVYDDPETATPNENEAEHEIQEQVVKKVTLHSKPAATKYDPHYSPSNENINRFSSNNNDEISNNIRFTVNNNDSSGGLKKATCNNRLNNENYNRLPLNNKNSDFSASAPTNTETFETLEEVQEVFQKKVYKPTVKKGKYSPVFE